MTTLLKERKTRSEKKSRKKVNYMMKNELLEKIEQFIPAGERSDFINEAVEEKIKDFMQKKAFEFFDEFQKKQKKSFSGKGRRKSKRESEMVKFIRNSRKNELLQ